MPPQPQITPDPQPPQVTVLPPPAHPPIVSTETVPPPSQDPHSDRKLTRNGKIARLPYLERDMVNRMLRNNIPHSKIVGALEEHGIRVTVRNVSNWKTRGGYKERS